MRLLKKVLRIVLWPLRFWRLALVGVLLLAAAQVIVDQVLLRKLAAQAERIRGEGRPVSYADLNLPEYTTIDNAYTVYEQAFDRIKNAPEDAAWKENSLLIARYVPTNPQVPRKSDDPLSEEERTRLGGYLQKMQPVLDLLRTSRNCRVCVIPDTLSEINSIGGDGSKYRAFTLPSISRMRELTRYTASKGLWECQRGNVDEGFDWFGLGLNIANNYRTYPTLLAGLSRISCIATVLGAVQSALYEGEAPAVLPATFAAELQKCCDRDIYSWTFECERLYSNERSIRMGFQTWRVLRPIYSLNQLKINATFLELSDIFQDGSFPAQEAKLKELQEWAGNATRIHLMAKILVPEALRSAESMRRCLASAEMCDLALMLKQFKQKNGAYPESLSGLGQSLPTDPFSGASFQYTREGGGFRLASAGKKVLSADERWIEVSVAWHAAK